MDQSSCVGEKTTKHSMLLNSSQVLFATCVILFASFVPFICFPRSNEENFPKSFGLQSKTNFKQNCDRQSFGIIVRDEAIKTESAYDPSMFHNAVITMQEKSKSETLDSNNKEAEINMRKAVQLAETGHRRLARKVFEHALALNPLSSEILNSFGEFLEQDNVVQADLLFQRAIMIKPDFSAAILNRKKTSPIVNEHDLKLFSIIDAKKSELYKYSTHHPTLHSAMKEFYYQHVYHTVALEGNTLTLEQIRMIIDHHIAVGGKSVMEHNEVVGVTEALQYMNNTLLKKGMITVEDVKNLHKRVLGFVDPIQAGTFRSNQVFVGRHIPPHPNEVDLFMEQFETWLNSDKVEALHPVEFAAKAHYRLVYIHPFVDGNGRTARLLMNFILMRNGFPPVSIELKDRWEYYETLNAGNEGDLRPFVRFIAKCTTKTLNEYLFAAELPYLSESTRYIDHNHDYFTVNNAP